MARATGENRILTTHVGSLPRATGLLDMMKARLSPAHEGARRASKRLGQTPSKGKRGR